MTERDWLAVGGVGLGKSRSGRGYDSGVDCMVLAFNALRLFGGI